MHQQVLQIQTERHQVGAARLKYSGAPDVHACWTSATWCARAVKLWPTVRVCMQYMAGTVGPPLPSTDMRLEAVPEMHYDPTGTPPRGEIMFKGPSVFSGYYKDQEKTAEVALLTHRLYLCRLIGEISFTDRKERHYWCYACLYRGIAWDFLFPQKRSSDPQPPPPSLTPQTPVPWAPSPVSPTCSCPRYLPIYRSAPRPTSGRRVHVGRVWLLFCLIFQQLKQKCCKKYTAQTVLGM